MKSTKKFLMVIALLCILLTMVGCNTKEEKEAIIIEEKTIRISTPIGPYSLPIFYMQEANLLGDHIRLDIQVHKNRQEAVAKINNNDVDILNLSLQEMAHMHNKDIPIRFLEVSNWATFRLMTLTDDLSGWDDLKGKEIYSSGKGGPIDLLTSAVLKHHGLVNGESITLKYMDQGELSQMVSNDLKNINIFVLREPYASVAMINNPKIKVIAELGDEWELIYNHKFPQSGTGALASFLDQEKELVELFIEKHEEAIEWVFNNPNEAAEIGEKYLKSFSKDVLIKAIDNMDMQVVKNTDAKEAIYLYFENILEFNPEMIGNKMPKESFYKGE